ncbi:hypothetical protein ATY78_02470 [Rhizobium sp. R635]|nr:hypothetical protein ATY78_02470 [Rhizobium sp. R635]
MVEKAARKNSNPLGKTSQYDEVVATLLAGAQLISNGETQLSHVSMEAGQVRYTAQSAKCRQRWKLC